MLDLLCLLLVDVDTRAGDVAAAMLLLPNTNGIASSLVSPVLSCCCCCCCSEIIAGTENDEVAVPSPKVVVVVVVVPASSISSSESRSMSVVETSLLFKTGEERGSEAEPVAKRDDGKVTGIDGITNGTDGAGRAVGAVLTNVGGVSGGVVDGG